MSELTDRFSAAQQEPDVFEEALTPNGVPSQQPTGTTQQGFHVHPQRLVSTRLLVTPAFGFFLPGGIDSPSEEFYFGAFA